MAFTRRRLYTGSAFPAEQRKLFYQKHILYVLFFILIWTLSSISCGIFTVCYFETYQEGEIKGNNTIYRECLSALNPSSKTAVIVLTNVRYELKP